MLPKAAEAVELDGMIGRLADHIEIDAGAEIAVAAALGEALQAVVVDGDEAARAAVSRLKTSDVSALLFVVGAADGAPVLPDVPMGARRLASCVRSTHPALDRLLTRLLAPFVLVDGGWAAALDIGLATPDRGRGHVKGDRFGGPTPWRAGPPGSSAVTPAALDEALEQAQAADLASEAAAERVEVERRARRRRAGPSCSRPNASATAGSSSKSSPGARPSSGARSTSAPRRSTSGTRC